MSDESCAVIKNQLLSHQQSTLQKRHSLHQGQATIKRSPEDFVVRENLQYDLSGEGDYVYLRIMKKGMNTPEIVELLSRCFQLPQDAIKYSGLKDRNATTTQWFSLQTAGDLIRPDVTIDNDGWEILDAGRHTNPLKTGLLAGNEFELTVGLEGIDPSQLQQYSHQPLIVPNFYGMQRFGNDGENAVYGMNLLTDKSSLRKFPKPKWKFFKRLFVSAYQAALFNLWLDQRLQLSKSLQIITGDLVQKTTTGGMFSVAIEEFEQSLARQEQGELVVTGPMFGYRMRQPTDQALQMETELLATFGLTVESFRTLGKVALGTRRPGVIVINDLTVKPVDDGVKLTFSLPAGAYATTVLQSLVSNVNSEE